MSFDDEDDYFDGDYQGKRDNVKYLHHSWVHEYEKADRLLALTTIHLLDVLDQILWQLRKMERP